MRHVGVLATFNAVFMFAIGLGCMGMSNETVKGSGVAKSEAREVERFSQIRIEGSADATIRIGDQQSLTVEADDNILPLITTRVDGDTLVVSSEESISPKTPVRVTITVPEFKAVAIAGSGDVKVTGLAGESFAADIRGSGDVTAAGSVERVNVSIRGSGDVKLADLTAKRGNVEVRGSGEVTVNASDELHVSVAGSGDVRYVGDPKVTKDISGSGDVRKAG